MSANQYCLRPRKAVNTVSRAQFSRNLRGLVLALLVTCFSATTSAQTAITNGYRDFSYTRTGSLTGEKPESKLWWNDGSWWGSLYDSTSAGYHIFKFNVSTQSWNDTGTVLDNRTSSRADTFWDDSAKKLYVVSHIFTTSGVATTSNWGKLFRYSYNSTTKTYSLDTGFPVDVTRGKSETLTVAKDSTGTLWVTYVESGRVMINHSLATESSWGTPFVLPVNSTLNTVTTDDISDVIAFDGNKVAVMWSNQSTSRFYFAIHQDGSSDQTWTVETPLNGPSGIADDHINLKTSSDGRVFAAVKTSLTNATDPLTLLLVRDPASASWASYTFGLKRDHHTRPIIQLDEDNNLLYMFATSDESGGVIYYKSTPINGIISFPTGLGTPFIQSATQTNINDASSTKSNVNGTTGILVEAADVTAQTYFHNALSLSSTAPRISSFTPTSGAYGAQVVITGTNLNDATGVTFGGTASSTFQVDSATQVTATVPSGASSGPITIVTPNGTAMSTTSFTVTEPPTIASFSPTRGPAGSAVTVSGTNFTGTTGVGFNGVSATSFTVTSSTQISVTVPSGASTGPITVTTPYGSANSGTSAFTVTFPPTVASFSPTSGPVGTSVQITGSYFNGATAVAFNGQSAGSYSVDSATQITATVPSSASSGPISVVTPDGSATSSTSFTVIRPEITSFSPTSGKVGTVVAINGQNLSNTTSVAFNGVAASSFQNVSSTQLRATVATGSATGPITVTTPIGTATSSTKFRVRK